MGTSKWFFSLSGVILAIGAIAIGAQGPQLRHRLRVGHPDHDGARATGDGGPGPRRPGRARRARRQDPEGRRPEARRQRLPDLDRGRSSRTRCSRCARRSTRTTGSANNFSNDSIGPTFGKTVANSAVIAIIASLIVISAYIALRFEWKYAVPVLIALIARHAHHGRRLRPARRGGDERDRRGPADDPRLLALRHDHRVRPDPGERAAHAAGHVLADRQPLDVRGARRGRWRPRSARCCRSWRCSSSAARRCSDFAFALIIGTARAPTRPSSSPRRCSRTGRSASPCGAVAARRSSRARRGLPRTPTELGGAPVDVAPKEQRRARRRLTAPDDPERGVSAAEFEEMVARHQP